MTMMYETDMFNDENENDKDDPIDLSLPFPADMTHCQVWNPGNML